ncbi:hypothetical protein Smp_166880 [Schistosoma mansoni]|uniref:hypothetical protein n=1 Tax=Schistosoma mansoni TaxID=6183 RepID=UPI00022C849C|nr:hypothetical protein Smp_166880 [Schistosoma mansoni]|eukprot:XP_018647285.1 hypothetical protein Smp_166880 [Schistosoma mansoni]
MPQSHGPIRRVCIHLVPVNFQAARSCRPPCAELSRAKVTNSLVARAINALCADCHLQWLVVNIIDFEAGRLLFIEMDISLSDNILASELDDQLTRISNHHSHSNSTVSTHVSNCNDFTGTTYFTTNVLGNVITHNLQHAINEASRLNSACDNDIDEIDGVCCDDDERGVVASNVMSSSSAVQQLQSLRNSVPAITTFHSISSSSSPCHLMTHPLFANIPITTTTAIGTDATNQFKCDTADQKVDENQYIHENENVVGKPDPTELGSNNCISHIVPSLMTTSSSRSMSSVQSSWRLLLRPIFEKALIERLWTSGELGSSNPHSLLLSMWFYISRHFGIGCRTDHAKLAYGNIVIGVNSTTGERHLQFTSLPHGAVSVGTLRKVSKSTKEFAPPVKPRQPDNLLPECLTKPDRCPVRLFEAFCSHRPCSSNSVESPFYLQPERCNSIIHASMNNPTWFTSNALGKNKIGSMLNGALQNIGMPVGRQVNLGRFCDSLIAAAFSQSGGGNVGEALRSLLFLNCRPNHHIPESLLPSIASYAENIVQMSTTPNSPVYTYLTKICSVKAVKNVKKTSIKLAKIPSKLSYSVSVNPKNNDHDVNDNNDGNNHSTNVTSNLPVTSTTNHTCIDRVGVNHLNPLSSTPTEGNVCINSKRTTICYNNHHSLDDEDDDVDDVAIDSFDLDNSNSSINNPTTGGLHSVHQHLHDSHVRTGIGTINNNNNNNSGNDELLNCLPKVKLSSSQENLNVDISQTYPFGNIIQAQGGGGQTLLDINSSQLVNSQHHQLQYSHFPQQQPLNNPTEFLFTPLSYPPNANVNISSFSPAVIFVPASYTTATGHDRMEFVAGPGGTGVDVSDSSVVASSLTISPNLGICSSISAALPLDENMIDISRLGGIENLIPTAMISSSTPLKQSSPEAIVSHCLQPELTTKSDLSSDRNDTIIRCQPNDDIRIDLRKTGGGSGRSVKLELRELLDLVLAAAANTPNSLVLADSGKIYSPLPGTSQRPPVGLVTQLLWRARALDDRGPWILTFSMWWLMQHYFGIGSRMHHVRLRWGHLRLVSNVIDPLTGELCEAIEYVGPSTFTTVKACALLESNSSSKDQPVRRVYPSSGWGEAEIAVASALASENSANRPRVRPLEIDPTVPPVPARSGPDFVSLYKSFARHRQQASLLPEAPFYVQPLQSSTSALQSKSAIAWFSVGALGKNRIGALMRNIVEKVVRPDMQRIATAALSAATTACVIAADRAALALNQHLNYRQRSLVDKLSCLLGTNMSGTANTSNDIPSTSSSPTIINNMNISRTINTGSNNTTTIGNNNNPNIVMLSRLDNPETTSILLSSTPTLLHSSRTEEMCNSNNQFLLKLPKLMQQSVSSLPSSIVSSCSNGHTFLAPSSSIYPPTSTATTTIATNQSNSYILMPNSTASISNGTNTAFNTTNLSLQQLEQFDPLQLQSHQTNLNSLQQSTFLLSSSSNPTLKTQNSLTTTTTNPTASSPAANTSRAFNQPVACHLISHPSSNNNNSTNAVPVNLILLSASTSPGFCSAPIVLNTTLQPQIQHHQEQSQSCNLQTVYQSDNRQCDFDFSLHSASRDGGIFMDSFQPLVIQRNDSNIATIVLNTSSDDTPVRRTINLMNSMNPTNRTNDSNSNNNNINDNCRMKLSQVSTSSAPTTTTCITTTTTTILPACNQIFYGRNSLRHQQLQSPLQVYEMSDHQNLTSSNVEGTSTTSALIQVSSLKSNYNAQNGSIVQALSYTADRQPTTITQPDNVAGVGDRNGVTQSQFSPLIETKLEPSINNSHSLLQQNNHLVTSSNSKHSQPIITFLPLNNNYLFNNSGNTLTSTATTTTAITGTITSTIAHEIGSTMSRTTTTNNNNKPDIYFEIPISNRDLSSSVQTVYRLLYTDNSGRTIITNETALINEAGNLVIINNDSNNNNNDNHGVSSENNSNNVLNAMSILGTEYSPYHSSSCASSSTDHYTIDHLPNIINRQLRPIPGSSVGFSSVSSTSTLTTASTLSVPLLSIGNTLTLSSTALKLQQSKHSSVTTSNVKNRLQTPNEHINLNINNNPDEIHVDFMNGMSNTGTTATTINTTTTATARNATNISFDDGNQSISDYHHQIKMEDNRCSSSSVMTTAANPMMSKGHHNMHNNNNNSNNTTNKNVRNNSLLTLPSLSSMTCHLIPVEPKPDQLRTLQSVINSASAFQCSDFPAYVEQLFRKGILGGRRPWCLNFTAWFINTLVFEVENRTEHVSLRWGDFRLCQTADRQTEYIYFINRITNKRYYLAGSPTSYCALGYKKSEFDMKSIHEPPVRCPCPVAIFKELRNRRPSGCLDPYSKFYLQPRNVECPDANDIEEIHDKVQKCHLLPANSNWFTEHAWGKNKLGGLFAEASKLGGLPTIWLRKHRSRNFFPGGGGSGIGALGNLHHHNQYFHKTDSNIDSDTNLYKSNTGTMEDNAEHAIITSKENKEMTSSTHTETKRRRLMNSVKDVVSRTTSNTTTTSTTAMVSTIVTTNNETMNTTMMMTVDQKARS